MSLEASRVSRKGAWMPGLRNPHFSAVGMRSMRGADRSIETRLGEKIRPDASGCWIWTGPRTTGGYGQVHFGTAGIHTSAHRLVYETLVGAIDDDKELHHVCEVPSCVNPAHLEQLTHADHMAGHAKRKRTA